VRAFKIINNTFPSSHLLIVGRGSQKEALKKLCDELRVSSCVTFVGPIKHELLPEYFAAADVFVLPSSMEGLPKALLEAMSMAKAIVATKVEGIANVVKDGENAMLFDVGKEGELATIVLRIFNDPLLESTLGMSARETIEREYAYEIVCHRYLDAINTYIISQG
jgi:glycosyltransferase involved in cell wall biosynthesis